jgi:hypothetical protein
MPYCRLIVLVLSFVATACPADEQLPYCGLEVKLASVHAELPDPRPPCMGAQYRASVNLTVGLDRKAHDVEVTIVDAPPDVDRTCLVEIVKGAMRGVRFTLVETECRYHMVFTARHNSSGAT